MNQFIITVPILFFLNYPFIKFISKYLFKNEDEIWYALFEAPIKNFKEYGIKTLLMRALGSKFYIPKIKNNRSFLLETKMAALIIFYLFLVLFEAAFIMEYCKPVSNILNKFLNMSIVSNIK